MSSDVVGVPPLAQSTVSQHLKVLKDASCYAARCASGLLLVEPRALRRVKALMGGL